MTIRLVIPGTPRGKGRPRFVKETGRAYTDAGTMSAEQLVQAAWMRAGSARIPEGPLDVTVTAVFERPVSHWRKDGTLTNLGVLHERPTRRPDADNLLKLILDALNGLAYRDDALIVTAHVVKRWAHGGEHAHTVIEVERTRVPALRADSR